MPLKTLTLRLRQTTLQGVPWSSYVNCPLRALTRLTVVVKRFGPGFLFLSRGGPPNRGKLWRPSLNCSTSMFQPSMSTFWTISSPLKMVHQGTLT
jgi:hypothetical protein